jgi:hypothetical protein
MQGSIVFSSQQWTSLSQDPVGRVGLQGAMIYETRVSNRGLCRSNVQEIYESINAKSEQFQCSGNANIKVLVTELALSIHGAYTV